MIFAPSLNAKQKVSQSVRTVTSRWALSYKIKKAYVLSNTREITRNGKITYIPIYSVRVWRSILPISSIPPSSTKAISNRKTE